LWTKKQSNTTTTTTDSSGLFYSYKNLWGTEITGVVNSDGSYNTNGTGKCSNFIPVTGSLTYTSNCLKTIYCYDSNKTYISTISPTLNNDSNYYAPRPFTTPANTAYIRANRSPLITGNIILIEGGIDKLPVGFSDIGTNSPNVNLVPDYNQVHFRLTDAPSARSFREQVNPLYGLKVNFLGDSITYGAYSNPDGSWVTLYHEFLAKRFNLTARNYGYAGSGFANLYNSADSAAYFQRALTMNTDADLVVVWGGFNDRQQPLGVFGDLWDSSSPTVYGGIDQTIKNIKNKFPSTPVVFLIHYANDSLTTPINTAVKTMCNYYKIPYIDLSETILNNNYDQMMMHEYWRTSDITPPGNQGIHPNSDGHRVLARHIANKIESILYFPTPIINDWFAPDAVTLTAGTVTSTTIPISWTAPTTSPDIATYSISYSSDGGNTYSVPVAVKHVITSYAVSGLSSNTTYTIKVVATDIVGNIGSPATITKATTV
jgi:lysophospholipase L1-like esterase